MYQSPHTDPFSENKLKFSQPKSLEIISNESRSIPKESIADNEDTLRPKSSNEGGNSNRLDNAMSRMLLEDRSQETEKSKKLSLEFCENVIALQVSALEHQSDIQDSKISTVSKTSLPYDPNFLLDLDKESKTVVSSIKQDSVRMDSYSKKTIGSNEEGPKLSIGSQDKGEQNNESQISGNSRYDDCVADKLESYSYSMTEGSQNKIMIEKSPSVDDRRAKILEDDGHLSERPISMDEKEPLSSNQSIEEMEDTFLNRVGHVNKNYS